MNTETEVVRGLFSFLESSPTAFHAVSTIQAMLDAAGYHELPEGDAWSVVPGGKYYVVRNQSSIIALHLGTELERYSFMIAASHSDSPTFKVKEKAVIAVRGKYTQLNTEGYGGMLCASWMDRPLSVAGRVLVKEGGRFVSKLVKLDRDLVLIPNVAIHMNREANSGFAYNPQVDMLPLFGGAGSAKDGFGRLIASELGVEEAAIYGSDLYLYNRMKPTVWGERGEFLSAPRLDDLECAYTSLRGF